MLNHYLIRQKVYQLLRVQQNYQAVSNQTFILHPEEERFHPTAIYLEDDFDRAIREVAPMGFPEGTVKQLKGGPRVHDATLAYRIPNARLIHGHVYRGRCQYSLLKTPNKVWIHEPIQYFSQAALACTWMGNQWFGDWMFCDIPLTLAARSIAPPIMMARPAYRDEPGYRELFQLPCTPVVHAHCKELFVIDDRGQNHYMRKRHESLRSLLRSSSPTFRNAKVMIKRGSDGAVRLIKNAAEVENFLVRQGFAIIETAKLTPAEIVQQTLGAQIVLGVEGSHLAHGIYTIADGGTILTLQPPYRFNSVFKTFTDCVDLNFAFLMGDGVEDNFTVNLERLARLLDKVEAVAGL